MGRYNKFYPMPRRTSMALQSGGSVSFYEPDQLLSENLNTKQMLGTEIAIRETAWNYYRVLGYLPNPSETLRKLGKDIAEYKYLMEDSHVVGCMNSRKAGTLSLKWTLDQNNADKKMYETLNSIFKNWPMSDIIAEMLNATFFGYQPAEVIWERNKGQWLPKEFVPKDVDWFRWSDINELRYLTKRNMVTGEPVPNYKFVVARYHASYERPYGRPLGSSVYWPVKFRHSGLRFWTEFCEKFGQPWLKASYPLGTQQVRIQEMMSMIQDTIRDGIVAFPSEFGVESMKMNDASSADIFQKFISEMNEEISIAILGQTLTTSTSKSGGGAYALGKVHAGIRKDIVDEDRITIERVFNTLISWVNELNWKSPNVPVFTMVPAPMPTKEDADMAASMVQAGFVPTTEFWKNRFGMLPEEFTIGPIPNQMQKVQGPDVNTAEESNLTHEANDPATNQATYDGTKDAVKNLTRR